MYLCIYLYNIYMYMYYTTRIPMLLVYTVYIERHAGFLSSTVVEGSPCRSASQEALRKPPRLAASDPSRGRGELGVAVLKAPSCRRILYPLFKVPNVLVVDSEG